MTELEFAIGFVEQVGDMFSGLDDEASLALLQRFNYEEQFNSYCHQNNISITDSRETLVEDLHEVLVQRHCADVEEVVEWLEILGWQPSFLFAEQSSAGA